jgi:hypothetical protein
MNLGIRFFAVMLTVAGCVAEKSTDERGLNLFIQEGSNGLRKIVETGDFKITTTYRPNSMIARQQMAGDEQRELDSLLTQYSKYMYFIVDISKNDKDLETVFALEHADFADRISFLSTRFSKDFSVHVDDDVRPIADFIYTRSYGVSSSKFLVAFENISDSDFHLVIDGAELGFGEIDFLFDQDQIKRIPKLQL